MRTASPGSGARPSTTCRAMNKNVAALLGVDDAQLTDFRPIVPWNVKQSSISDLSAHLGIERSAIENDIYFLRCFARQHGFDNCFRLQKIISKKFGRLGFELAFFNTDFFLLLRLARTLALFVHQSSRSRRHPL